MILFVHNFFSKKNIVIKKESLHQMALPLNAFTGRLGHFSLNSFFIILSFLKILRVKIMVVTFKIQKLCYSIYFLIEATKYSRRFDSVRSPILITSIAGQTFQIAHLLIYHIHSRRGNIERLFLIVVSLVFFKSWNF